MARLYRSAGLTHCAAIERCYECKPPSSRLIELICSTREWMITLHRKHGVAEWCTLYIFSWYQGTVWAWKASLNNDTYACSVWQLFPHMYVPRFSAALCRTPIFRFWFDDLGNLICRSFICRKPNKPKSLSQNFDWNRWKKWAHCIYLRRRHIIIKKSLLFWSEFR